GVGRVGSGRLLEAGGGGGLGGRVVGRRLKMPAALSGGGSPWGRFPTCPTVSLLQKKRGKSLAGRPEKGQAPCFGQGCHGCCPWRSRKSWARSSPLPWITQILGLDALSA